MKQVFHIFISKQGMSLSVICSQVPVRASGTRDRELPGATSLPAKVNLGLLLGEGEDGHAKQVTTSASASEGNTSLGEPDEDGNHSHHSHSTASSQCSATYSNLGKLGTTRVGVLCICAVNILHKALNIYLKTVIYCAVQVSGCTTKSVSLYCPNRYDPSA